MEDLIKEFIKLAETYMDDVQVPRAQAVRQAGKLGIWVEKQLDLAFHQGRVEKNLDLVIDTLTMARDEFLIEPEQLLRLIPYFKAHYKFIEELEKLKEKS